MANIQSEIKSDDRSHFATGIIDRHFWIPFKPADWIL
jgi:hypothetical protein